MSPEHILADCPQNPTLIHIMKTLDRLDGHGERTALAMEKMAENSATINAHADKLKQHDTAFIELFNWRRDFTEKVNELEKQQAVNNAVEEVVDAIDEKKFKFWTIAEAKLKIATPFIITIFFIVWVIDKTGFAISLLKLIKEFSK